MNVSRTRPFLLVAPFVGILAASVAHDTRAADHNDPVGVQAGYQSGTSADYDVSTGDPSADIADVFAWYAGEKAIFALTWRADPTRARELAFDPFVKYTIHIDDAGISKLLDVNVGDDGLHIDSRINTPAEHREIVTWFGKSRSGEWGMQVTGVPKVDKLVGPVGKVHEPAPGVKIAAGLFDDAFFADLDGFFNSISVALPELIPNYGNPSLPRDRFDARIPGSSQDLKLPFGYPVDRIDGFGKQNVHAVIVEVPISSFRGRKLHVWGTTDRAPGLGKSGTTLGCSYNATEGTYACKDRKESQ